MVLQLQAAMPPIAPPGEQVLIWPPLPIVVRSDRLVRLPVTSKDTSRGVTRPRCGSIVTKLRDATAGVTAMPSRRGR